MSVSEYREDFISLIPALRQLINLGYQYLSPSEALDLRNGKKKNAVLDSILQEQLGKFNSFTYKGETHKFTQSNIEKAVRELRDIPFDNLITTNEEVYDLITLGKSFEQSVRGDSKSFTINYVDWNDANNNVFHICDEFIVERRHSHQTRRPDIVLFINGIPLAVIECKRPDKINSTREAISQHIRNHIFNERSEWQKDKMLELWNTGDRIKRAICRLFPA